MLFYLYYTIRFNKKQTEIRTQNLICSKQRKGVCKELMAWTKSDNSIVKIQNLCYNNISPLEDTDEIRRYKNDRNFE